MYVPWHVITLGLAALVVLALLYWLWRDVREAVERAELTPDELVAIADALWAVAPALPPAPHPRDVERGDEVGG